MTDDPTPIRFDPQTGEPVTPTDREPLFDPNTGEPLRPLPQFDAFTGKRLPARATRWWPRRPGVGFYVGQGALALLLALAVLGEVRNHKSAAGIIVGVVIIAAIGVPLITTVSFVYRKVRKLP